MNKFSALSFSLLMIMTSLAGCIFPHQFQGTHVGSFETDSLGTGTSSSNDKIVSLELIHFSVNTIEFSDCSGIEDCGDGYLFRILVGDLNDENRPIYDCKTSTVSYSADCLIVESVDDGVWEVGEIITLEENGVDICSSSCQVQLTIMNGDIEHCHQEENLQYIAQKSIGGPVSHTFNFWMSQ
tara:strand:- start:378 stop:926 length:549 start_codon:yes stop_codon:yes gene_type:complete